MQHVLSRLSGVQSSGQGYKALCPAHSDFSPSLEVAHGEGGRVLLNCHAGCPTDAVLEALGLTWPDVMGDGSASSVPRRSEASAEDLALRDEVYSGLISLLPLSDEHRRDLQGRGLSDHAISLAQYRTLAFPGTRKALKALHERHGESLYRVPGFADDAGKPKLYPSEGLFIPVRDPDGRVVGAQVRVGERGGKYRWMSTRDAPSGSPVHFPITLDKGDWPKKRVWVTEGPLKADVASYLTAKLVLGTGGSSAAMKAQEALKLFPSAEVVLAFDMDRLTNEGVAAREAELAYRLRDSGREVLQASWDASLKGLDDAAAAGAHVEVAPYPFDKRPASTDGPAAPGKGGVVRASEVEEKSVEWVWDGWVPRGAVTLLEGDPGLGKSFLFCQIAAHVSAGRRLPGDSPKPPGVVLVASCEDDIRRTLKPRLRAAGADLDRVVFWEGVDRGKGDLCLPTFPEDMARLEQIIRETGATLVIIDPLVAYCSVALDLHKDQHAREIISALTKAAERTQCAILCLRHLTKMAGSQSLYRGSGSIGIIGGARSTLRLERDQENPSLRHLFHIKSNLAPESRPLRLLMARRGGDVSIEFDGESDARLSDLLKQHRENKTAEAEAWLAAQLSPGPRRAGELFKDARDGFGWDRHVLNRARKAIGVSSDKVGDHWEWRLPDGQGEQGQGGQA